jgi:ABC-2 type transport system permease protein
MIGAITIFELRKRLTMLSTYVYLVLFFAMGLLSMFAAGGAFSSVSAGAGSERVFANAPVRLGGLIALLSYLGVMMSAAVFGQAVHQDFEARIDSLLFTLPIKKSAYLTGRFLGAFIFVLVVFLMIGLGTFVGAHFPVLIDKTLFGPTPFVAYLWPYVTSVLPNLLFTGALFFALGTLGRKMMPVYIGTVIVVLGYLISRILLSDVENLKLAALIDPFGGAAIAGITRYWSVSEQNHKLILLSGHFGEAEVLFFINRAIWAGLGVAMLAATFARFTLGHVGVSEKRQAVSNEAPPESAGLIPAVPIERSDLAALITLTRLGFQETVKNSYFAVILLAGMIFTVTLMALSGKLNGTPTWPVTRSVASAGEAFTLFLLIIITFYSGEIVWRERDLNLAQITDALPTKTWVTYVSKLISLCLIPVLLLASVIVVGVAFQTFKGYYHYELGLYFERFYVLALPDYLFLCVLAFFVQSTVQNKYVGHFIMVAYYVALPFMDKIGLEHGLLKLGDTPSAPYSDMNGFGHYLKPRFAFDVYWGGFALMMAVIGGLFWTRGVEQPFGVRASIARERFSGPLRAIFALGLVIAVVSGGYIYRNENVINRFISGKKQEAMQAQFEKKYKALDGLAQPRITAVRVGLDLFPETETLLARGEYQLENKTGEPIATVYVRIPPEQSFEALTVGESRAPAASDADAGLYTYKLEPALAPGAKTTLKFAMTFHDNGFKAEGNRSDLAANGTFFHSNNLPALGYDSRFELEQDNDRKKYGLAPRERMPDLFDKKGLQNNLISLDSDWITFDATVSTSADQLAVVPGRLEKEWTDHGRRYFHYVSDSPILNFFALNSARYAVAKDQWNNLPLEIDYHPTHDKDLAEMFAGMKDGLSYYTANFGPFQFDHLRILEFPAYASYAQSFPATIPFSEGIGFVLRVDPNAKDVIDFPYYVTAHEVAHQWWAHQLIGGNVQGVTLLDETLAQYSALMVMKAHFGAPKMRRFLKYEMDQYLTGRTLEQKKEVPLLRVENQQYIHYRKGSVVMYALQDYIGEAAVNTALKALLDRYKFKGPPYPNAQALLDELKKVTPPELQYLLVDLFEKITLYDNRCTSAVASKRPDGSYDLTMHLSIKKMQAGEQGEEQEAPADDLIDVGALDGDNEPIAVNRVRLKTGETQITIQVAKLPARAGIDPMLKLIDRHPDDNTVAVTLAESKP